MQDLGVEFEWRDFVKNPLSKAELEKLIGNRPVEKFLNPRSTPFKELGLKGKKVSKNQAVPLMLKDMNLLKRPLLVKGNKYIFGLDEEAYRNL